MCAVHIHLVQVNSAFYRLAGMAQRDAQRLTVQVDKEGEAVLKRGKRAQITPLLQPIHSSTLHYTVESDDLINAQKACTAIVKWLVALCRSSEVAAVVLVQALASIKIDAPQPQGLDLVETAAPMPMPMPSPAPVPMAPSGEPSYRLNPLLPLGTLGPAYPPPSITVSPVASASSASPPAAAASSSVPSSSAPATGPVVQYRSAANPSPATAAVHQQPPIPSGIAALLNQWMGQPEAVLLHPGPLSGLPSVSSGGLAPSHQHASTASAASTDAITSASPFVSGLLIDLIRYDAHQAKSLRVALHGLYILLMKHTEFRTRLGIAYGLCYQECTYR